MQNWESRLNSIPEEITGESDFDTRFMYPFLQDLGYENSTITYNKTYFTNIWDRCKPDFVCWSGPEENSTPFLIVEDKAVKSSFWDDACKAVHRSLQIASTDLRFSGYQQTAQFGIASNGINIQLFQRHGKLIVPRTPVRYLRISEEIPKIILEIRNHLENPRRALTLMLWNNKGGIGKTTLTAHLGTALASKEELTTKVLIINFDLQGDLNKLFRVPPIQNYENQYGLTIYDALKDATLRGSDKVDSRALLKRINGYLHIVPGDLSMFEVESENLQANWKLSLKYLLQKMGAYQEYDYIFIDCAPSWRGMGEVAAYASDIIIPIINGDEFSALALDRVKNLYLNPNQLEGKWRSSSEIPPEIPGYIFNKFVRSPTVHPDLRSRYFPTIPELAAINYFRGMGLAKHPISPYDYRRIRRQIEDNTIIPATEIRRSFYKTFITVSDNLF